jgi:hypothetical protein
MTSKQPYEPYVNVECPVCGYGEAIDHGPYEPHPSDEILGPVDPDVHYLTCGRCGKGWDAAPPEAIERYISWLESARGPDAAAEYRAALDGFQRPQ